MSLPIEVCASSLVSHNDAFCLMVTTPSCPSCHPYFPAGCPQQTFIFFWPPLYDIQVLFCFPLPLPVSKSLFCLLHLPSQHRPQFSCLAPTNPILRFSSPVPTSPRPGIAGFACPNRTLRRCLRCECGAKEDEQALSRVLVRAERGRNRRRRACLEGRPGKLRG